MKISAGSEGFGANRSVPSVHITSFMYFTLFAATMVMVQPLWMAVDHDRSIFFGVELFLALLFAAASFIWVARVLIHPYIFLLATLSLFIGGRFIALAIIDQPVFSDANYVPITLSFDESVQLMSKITGALLMMHFGILAIYLLGSVSRLRLPSDQPKTDLALASLVLLLISAAVSIVAIAQHYAACSKFGYLAIYQDQKVDNLLRLASMGQYGLLLGAGLAFTTSRKWLHVLAMALVTGYFIAYLGVGLRSGFLSLVLMGVWLIHTRVKKLNIFTLVLVPIVMIALAQLAITVGCRAQPIASAEAAVVTLPDVPIGQPTPDSAPVLKQVIISHELPGVPAPVGPPPTFETEVTHYQGYLSAFAQRLHFNELGWFTYLQGSTLVYTGAAFRLDGYPMHAYFQTFIPGYSQVAGRLDPKATPADFYFPHYLAKSYSAEKYESGFGMGWSLFADFEAYSFGNPFLYAAVATVFGLALGYFFVAAEISAFFMGALVCVFLKITLLPRSGLYSVIPYLVVFALLYYLGKLVYHYSPPMLKKLMSL